MKNKIDNKSLDFLKNESINILSRIFLSSVIVISFFYVAPIFINFAEKNLNNKEFTNNSKKILAYTLDSKDQAKVEGEILNEEDLLFDIFSLNELESDTVRLSASTIKQ
jgi:Bax protein